MRARYPRDGACPLVRGPCRARRGARFRHTLWLSERGASRAWVELDFPAEPPEATVPPPGLLSALAVDPRYVGRNRFDYLVEVDSETTVRALAPDLRALQELEARGVIVTSRGATAGFDFVSRFFAPAVGIDEDPVTGSAHCCLAPYWRSRLDRAELTGFQASTRGGVVRTCVEDDRVRLGGQAVTVLRATLTTQ